jgi:hypothetical protein
MWRDSQRSSPFDPNQTSPTFQMAEVAIPRNLFAGILRHIDGQPPPDP